MYTVTTRPPLLYRGSADTFEMGRVHLDDPLRICSCEVEACLALLFAVCHLPFVFIVGVFVLYYLTST